MGLTLTEDPVAFSSPYANSLFSFRGTHNSGNTFQIAVGGEGSWELQNAKAKE